MSPSLISGLGVAGVILFIGVILVAACCGAGTGLAFIFEGLTRRLP